MKPCQERRNETIDNIASSFSYIIYDETYRTVVSCGDNYLPSEKTDNLLHRLNLKYMLIG